MRIERPFEIVNSDLELPEAQRMHMTVESGGYLDVSRHIDGHKIVIYLIKHDESSVISPMF